MHGMLLGAFCERGEDRASHCLELWAYPDTSLNLVVNRMTEEGEEEYAFPCSRHSLVGLLRQGRRFLSETEIGRVVLERKDGNLTAEFHSSDGNRFWRQSVPVEPFASALARIDPEIDPLAETLV